MRARAKPNRSEIRNGVVPIWCFKNGQGLPAFSAHSLRSGFVTEADRQGVRLADTMALTGHTSVATVLGYTRASESNRATALKTLGALRGPGAEAD